MQHTHTQALLDYWETRRLGQTAPARADILPQDLSNLLAHLFILRRFDREHHIFRLAGTALCELHQREFREQNFLSLWRGFDRAHMTALIEGALAAPAPATAMAEAQTIEGRSSDIEIAILPLRGPEGWVDRCLGLYQPLNPEALKKRPVVRLFLKDMSLARLPKSDLNCFANCNDETVTMKAANDKV